jgi:serine/threonine protein kinase/transcriptional regulator with XRE-family HTH domain
MGRRERPLAPGPLSEFAHDLRQLRATAGLTYRVMAERARYSASALSSAASSQTFPSLAVTRAYVAACGGDVAAWEQRWRELAARLRDNSPEDVSAETENDGAPAADEPRFTLTAPEPVPGPAPRHARVGVEPALRLASARPRPAPDRKPGNGRHRRADAGYAGARAVVTDARAVVPGARAVVPGAGAVVPGARAVVPGARAVVPGARAVVPGAGAVLPDAPGAPGAPDAPDVLPAPTTRDAARPQGSPSPHGRPGSNGIWHARKGAADGRDGLPRPREPAGLAPRGKPPRNIRPPAPAVNRKKTVVLPGVTPLRQGDPGQVGPIVLAGLLGEGPVGRLYLGRDGEGRPAAVKVIHPGLAEDRYFRVRLAQELEALRTVRGPYLSSVTGGDAGGSPVWLAKAYVPAVSLREAVTALGSPRPETVRRLAAGIARALRDIHAANVMHHRLTPDNVLLTESGPLIADFGMSAAVDRGKLSVGDARPERSAFLAPEQVAGGPAGMAADVFALGGLLAYALTGCAPFGDDRPEAVMTRIISGTPNLMAAAVLDAHLAAIINACLNKDPLARPRLAELRVQIGAAEPVDGWLPPPLTDLVRRRAAEVAAALQSLPPDRGAGRHPIRRNDPSRIRSAMPSAAPARPAIETARSEHRRTTSGSSRSALSAPTGRIKRRGRRRKDTAQETGLWLAPLILTLAIVTVYALVAITGGSTTILSPIPAPAPHGHSTGPSAAQGQQPGGSTFATGRPRNPGQEAEPPQKQKIHKSQQQQPAVTFTATAGPFCPPTRSASAHAARSPAGVGWHTATATKPADDGCGNKFLFTPLAGYASDSELRENHFDWSFRTGRSAPHCTLDFFVPFSARASSSAVIWISNGSRKASYNPAYRIASFIVNQADNRGQWFSIGPFTFPGGTVFAELTNTGDGPYGGTVVASALRVTCNGSH